MADDIKDGGKSSKKPGAGQNAKPEAESREDRLGDALRANLRRRKAQARGRKTDASDGGERTS